MVEEREIAFLRATGDPDVSAARPAAATDPEAHRSRRKKHRKKPGGGLAVFVIGWIVFLGLVAALATLMRQGREGGGGGGTAMTDAAVRQREINEAYQACTERVRAFLRDATPEVRAKLVHQPAETLRRMARFGGAALLVAEEEKWEWQYFIPLTIEGEDAFEGVIVFDDGKRAEFVFLRDAEGEWGIDWANLVRYSEHPWSMFLSGDTPPAGEFRLLARRRAGSGGEMGDATSIVFLAPDPWKPRETRRRSPAVAIPPASRTALMLEEAFRRLDEKRGSFGSRLGTEDPHSMIRVRVRLRRIDSEAEDEDFSFELEELLGCHWISVDDPGVDVGAE